MEAVMDKPISDESVTWEHEDEPVNVDNVKAAQEADLLEGGRYKFQIESAEGAVADKEYFDEEQKAKNPFYGKTVYNCRVRLSAKRDGKGKDAPYVTMERPRTIFQRVTNASVLDRRGELSIESKLFGQMASIVAAETGGGISVRQVLEHFKANAGEITLTLSPEKEDPKTGNVWPAKNWVRGIKAYRA